MKSKKIILVWILVCTLVSMHLTAQKEYNPIIKKSIFFGKSKAIRDATVILPGIETEMMEVEANPFAFKNGKSQINQKRHIPENMQDRFGSVRSRGPALNFEGVGNVNGTWPADPNGDAGLNHYVQSVNNSTAVWDKNGNLLFGPVHNKSFFEAFPGPWNYLGWADPVFIYDELADRWVFTSMSLNVNQNQYYEMIAVSVSPDPLGEYYCYAYQFENINDYPKMSVWTNGYYLTYNIFEYTTEWNYIHSIATVVDRDAMLAGEPEATMIQFILETQGENVYRFSPLTSDFSGTVLPENPACIVEVSEFTIQETYWEANIIFFEMVPDWLVPENSTFDSITQTNMEGVFTLSEPGAPQPGNFHNVEVFNTGSLMYPFTYRNFGDYQSMVGCQSMYNGEQYYISWYEFRKDASEWYVYQTGNYMPDAASRYMPSISINGKGDMAMVFTKSSLDTYPTICFTGRKSGDELGMMTISELEIFKGLNYVNNYTSGDGRNRWGDYASMVVDPEDDSTFWFTSMYPLADISSGNWSTRIAAINLSSETSPYAFAGPDTIICFDEAFLTDGEASNYSSINWETNGDGHFINSDKLRALYVRGNNDIANGNVGLFLHITGYEPGSSVVDSMVLYLNQFPLVYAGLDDTICIQHSYSCQGDISFSENYYWTSNGYGIFNDSTLLNAIYTPDLNDTTLEYVILTLHAEPLFPCTEGAEDELRLYITTCTGVAEMEKDIHMIVFPNPSTGNVTIEIDQLDNQKATIQVLNAMGQRIFSSSYTSQSSKLKKHFDFRMLPSGTYYVKVLNGSHVNTMQLVIR